MPVLEAMAAGIPLVCSNIEPLRSTAGDAALLFDPNDAAGMADALRRIADDTSLRERLAAAGPERAHKFTWERAARQTLDALRS